MFPLSLAAIRKLGKMSERIEKVGDYQSGYERKTCGKSGVILQKLMLGGSATKAKMRLELDAE